MKIFFDNVNFKSDSGPNSFALKLANAMDRLGHRINQDVDPDVQLSFINDVNKVAPMFQRLDGIYFNSSQDWQSMNEPIRRTYESAVGVIFQSHFNKILTERYFGVHPNSCVIHNGTNLTEIQDQPAFTHPDLDNFDRVWACASAWRPHKRLPENIRYFLENSAEKDCLLIAGKNSNGSNSSSNLLQPSKNPRIFYMGQLERQQLIRVYKRADYFVHLALMDHCPNVVVDARAAGCKIICASSGGTKEIAGADAIVIQDMDWDYKPFALYEPLRLNFTHSARNTLDNTIDINLVAQKYISMLETSRR